jgi:hypothetical protein
MSSLSLNLLQAVGDHVADSLKLPHQEWDFDYSVVPFRPENGLRSSGKYLVKPVGVRNHFICI